MLIFVKTIKTGFATDVPFVGEPCITVDFASRTTPPVREVDALCTTLVELAVLHRITLIRFMGALEDQYPALHACIVQLDRTLRADHPALWDDTLYVVYADAAVTVPDLQPLCTTVTGVFWMVQCDMQPTIPALCEQLLREAPYDNTQTWLQIRITALMDVPQWIQQWNPQSVVLGGRVIGAQGTLSHINRRANDAAAQNLALELHCKYQPPLGV